MTFFLPPPPGPPGIPPIIAIISGGMPGGKFGAPWRGPCFGESPGFGPESVFVFPALVPLDLAKAFVAAAAFVPLADDIFLPNLSDRLQDCVTVAARVMEADQRRAEFVADIFITRSELVAEHV